MTDITWAEPLTEDEGVARATAMFRERYGYEPAGVWSAPGRVNLIGEHTDYNGGMCLPIALPHRAFVAVALRDDRMVRLTDRFVPEGWEEVDLDAIGPVGTDGALDDWTAYLAGVLWALEHPEDTANSLDAPLPGCDIALVSCVPRGGGLSSSAALECATAVAIDELAGLGFAGTTEEPNDSGRAYLVEACRRAENDIAGAPTGGLDQSASLRCQAGHALELDCRDNSVAQVPFDLAANDLELLVIDTKAPHSLNDGQYKARRDACEAAASILKVGQLVDVPYRELEQALSKLDDDEQVRRVRHVVTEIERTKQTCAALRAGSGEIRGDVLRRVGELFNASHDSLRDDYEVTCPELDCAVEVARAHGAYGARMTGGGFGGSAIALIAAGTAEFLATQIVEAYAQKGFNPPEFLRAIPGAAAGRVA